MIQRYYGRKSERREAGIPLTGHLLSGLNQELHPALVFDRHSALAEPEQEPEQEQEQGLF